MGRFRCGRFTWKRPRAISVTQAFRHVADFVASRHATGWRRRSSPSKATSPSLQRERSSITARSVSPPRHSYPGHEQPRRWRSRGWRPYFTRPSYLLRLPAKPQIASGLGVFGGGERTRTADFHVAKRARRNPVNRTYANSPLLACGSTRQYAAARGRMRNFRRARSRPEQRINPSGSRHPTDSPRRCRSDPAVRDTCRPAFVGTSWGACRAPDPSGWPLVPPRPLGDHTDETFGPFCRDRPRVTRRSESETGVRVRERTPQFSD